MGGDTNGDGTASQPSPSAWNSLQFVESGTGTLEYCQVRYGGWWESAGVVIRGSAAPTIANSEISDVGGIGIRIYDQAPPVLSPNNSIERCSEGSGVLNNGTATVNARNNWWGDASGPLHVTLDPSGRGLRVSDRVDFEPYLAQKPGAAVAAPAITSGPAASAITQTGATISWLTDKSSTTIVEYGVTAAYGSQATGNEVTSHTVMLSGLTAGVTYHYRVRSTALGLTVTSSDYTFTTTAAATAPVITAGPTVSNVTATAATLTWTTDRSSTTDVVYGTTMTYGFAASGPEGASHAVTLSGLSPGTTYHYQVRSASGSGIPTASVDRTLTTSAAPATAIHLRVKGFVGAKQVASPLSARVGCNLSFEVWAFAEADSSDLQEVTDFTWQVPARLGTVTGLGQLSLTTVAGVSDSVVFQARGGRASFRISTTPHSIVQVEITPADLVIAPGQRQTFRARALDQYGNAVLGKGFRWHTVGDIGTINVNTGAFVAAGTPGQGYVIAVVSSAPVFGDVGASVRGSGKVVVESPLPEQFALSQNAPNPFNSSTAIAFELPVVAHVRLNVYNLVGQLVAQLVDQPLPAGHHRIRWNASGQPTGVFIYQLEAGDFRQQRKMMLVR